MNKDDIKNAIIGCIAEEAGIDIVSSYPSLNIVYIKGNVENLRVFYSLLKISSLADLTLLSNEPYFSDEIEKVMRVTYAKEEYDFIKGTTVPEAIYTHPAPF